jgi:hypothetical protein
MDLGQQSYDIENSCDCIWNHMLPYQHALSMVTGHCIRCAGEIIIRSLLRKLDSCSRNGVDS